MNHFLYGVARAVAESFELPSPVLEIGSYKVTGQEEIADLREKYLADSRRALLKKIKSKKVASHPAWEDLIAWENLEAHLRTLHKTLKKLG